MPKISFEITAEDRDLSGALQRMQREIAKLEEANRRLVSQSKSAAAAAKQANADQLAVGDKVMGQVKGMAAAYLSVGAAIRVMNAELERRNRLEDQAKGAQLGAAAAERGFVTNTGVTTPAARDAALRQIQGVSRAYGVPYADALAGASAGIGFSGSVQPTLDALKVGARYNPYDVANLTPGLLATKNVTGSTDARANLGFLIGAQQGSPIKSTSLVAQNLIPAAAGVRLTGGDTDVEAASVVNALGFALGDVTGEQSGTAAQRAAAVLAKTHPQLGSTVARIKYLQQNPSEVKRVAGSIEQGATKAAILSLFDPNSQAAGKLNESLQVIPGSTSARINTAEAAIALASGTDLQQSASLDRRLGTQVERLRMSNTDAARRGIVRERFGEMVDQSEAGLIPETLARWNYTLRSRIFGADPIDTALSNVEGLARNASTFGNSGTAGLLRELIGEVRAMRNEQFKGDDASRAMRQNATNDLDRHTEGR